VAKAGLLSLARTVAAEYAADRIRMNVVAGGAISTGVANTVPEQWVDGIPVGRYGTSDDVADAAIYLLSDVSAYVTGQQIVVDGGVSVRGPFAQTPLVSRRPPVLESRRGAHSRSPSSRSE